MENNLHDAHNSSPDLSVLLESTPIFKKKIDSSLQDSGDWRLNRELVLNQLMSLKLTNQYAFTRVVAIIFGITSVLTVEEAENLALCQNSLNEELTDRSIELIKTLESVIRCCESMYNLNQCFDYESVSSVISMVSSDLMKKWLCSDDDKFCHQFVLNSALTNLIRVIRNKNEK